MIMSNMKDDKRNVIGIKKTNRLLPDFLFCFSQMHSIERLCGEI